jgi:DNA-binding NarL/FixJ family response regulator
MFVFYNLFKLKVGGIMEQLTSQDTRNLLQSIQSLYSFKSLDTFALETLTILEQLVPTESSVMFTHAANFDMSLPMAVQSRSPDFERLLMSDKVLPLINAAALHNPLIKNMPITATGAHKFSDFSTHQELYSLEFLRDISEMVESDDHMMLGLYDGDPANILHSPEPVAYYYFYRQWDTWTERDRLILSLLQPHLIQAYKIANRFQHLQQRLAQLQQSVDQSGVIFLDVTGRAQWITTQAKQWLRQYFPHMSGLNQLPEEIQSWITSQTACLNVLEDTFSVCSPLCLQQQDSQLVIRLAIDPATEQYMLLLSEERTFSLANSLELLGLSKREAEVLLGVIQGQKTKAIAQSLQISTSTVRKHLENICHKLNVQSRTEAISQVLNHLGILNSPPIL